MSSMDVTIGSTTIDLEDICSSEELTEIIESALEGMTAEERAAALETFEADLEASEESAYADLDDLEAELHALMEEYGDDPDNYLVQRKEAEIDDLNAVLDQIDMLPDCFETASETAALFNLEDPSTVDLTNTEYENGDTITVTLNGSEAANLFEDSDAEALTQFTNTCNINIGNGTIELASVGENERTLKITREDGTCFYATFIGSANFVFNGTNYITNIDSLELWPDDFLGMCYDGELSANSNFKYRVHGFDSEEVAETIPVSDDLLDNINTEFEALDNLLTESTIYSRMEDVDSRDPLTTEEKNLIQDIMLKLFGSEVNISGGPSIASVWEEITDLLGDLSMDSQNKIYTAIAYLISKYDGENLPIYVPAINAEQMTQAMTYYDYAADIDSAEFNGTSLDAYSKMGIICFLELYPDSNIVDGDLTAFLADNSNSIENAMALDFVKSFMAVTEALEGENTDAAMNPNMKVSEELYNSMISENNMDNFFRAHFLNYNQDPDFFTKYYDDFQALMAEIYAPDGHYDTGYMSAAAIRNKVKNFISGYDNKSTQAILASMFFVMMGSAEYGGDPAFLETLCLDKDWAEDMYTSFMTTTQAPNNTNVTIIYNTTNMRNAGRNIIEGYTGLDFS